MLKYIRSQGGFTTLAERNENKANLLYDYIDSESFYTNPVSKADRSWMNVPFTLKEHFRNPAPELAAGAEADTKAWRSGAAHGVRW